MNNMLEEKISENMERLYELCIAESMVLIDSQNFSVWCAREGKLCELVDWIEGRGKGNMDFMETYKTYSKDVEEPCSLIEAIASALEISLRIDISSSRIVEEIRQYGKEGKKQ